MKQKKIKLVIDDKLLTEYWEYYKKFHPTARTSPIKKPKGKDKTKGYVHIMTTNEFTSLSGRIVQNNYKDAWKSFVLWAAKKYKFENWNLEKARITVSWYWENNRRHDIDNASFCLKFILDGLVAAHTIIDDKFGMLEIVLDCEHRVDKNNPRTEFLIEEI